MNEEFWMNAERAAFEAWGNSIGLTTAQLTVGELTAFKAGAEWQARQAPADGVAVSRELLERLETWVVDDCSALVELRALLAQQAQGGCDD